MARFHDDIRPPGIWISDRYGEDHNVLRGKRVRQVLEVSHKLPTAVQPTTAAR